MVRSLKAPLNIISVSSSSSPLQIYVNTYVNTCTYNALSLHYSIVWVFIDEILWNSLVLHNDIIKHDAVISLLHVNVSNKKCSTYSYCNLIFNSLLEHSWNSRVDLTSHSSFQLNHIRCSSIAQPVMISIQLNSITCYTTLMCWYIWCNSTQPTQQYFILYSRIPRVLTRLYVSYPFQGYIGHAGIVTNK